jgi:hypothetical protein
MLTQAEARIYLKTQRGLTQSEGFRSYHTFNFGDYISEGKEPVGQLIAFNDQILNAGQRVGIEVSSPTEIILLPVVGGLELVDGAGESVFIGVGESFRFIAFPENDFKISNPYPVETVNYLQIHLRPNMSDTALNNLLDDSPLNVFSLEEKNKLVPAFTSSDKTVVGKIGLYGGRQEETVVNQNTANVLFSYVISGAFEVQNRLLEVGDALTLWNAEELEFEALSDGAVVLVMEVGESLKPS